MCVCVRLYIYTFKADVVLLFVWLFCFWCVCIACGKTRIAASLNYANGFLHMVENVISEVGLFIHSLTPYSYTRFFHYRIALFIQHGPSFLLLHFFFHIWFHIVYIVGECESIATTFWIWFIYMCVFAIFIVCVHFV